jgi:hypothetical protein
MSATITKTSKKITEKVTTKKKKRLQSFLIIKRKKLLMKLHNQSIEI